MFETDLSQVIENPQVDACVFGVTNGAFGTTLARCSVSEIDTSRAPEPCPRETQSS